MRQNVSILPFTAMPTVPSVMPMAGCAGCSMTIAGPGVAAPTIGFALNTPLIVAGLLVVAAVIGIASATSKGR
jgi:uncharacterized membrane protein YdcZ (DUF606 family)